MDCFALKGTFIDTPTPDALRVREGYLLCENGLCACLLYTSRCV